MGLLQTGRTGQVYAKKQSAQGSVATVAATDAVRHRQILFPFDPKNKINTEEKQSSPGRSASNRVDMRETATWSYEGLLRPSGTIATAPDLHEVLECAFGSVTTVSLSTTVASGGTVNGATLTASTGLAKHDFVLITCPDGKRRLRRLTAAPASNVVAWSPALPTGQQPANGAAVKGCITYKLSSALILALTICHYLRKSDGTAGLARQVYDAAVEAFGLSFDASGLPIFKANGFAKTMQTAQAQPGAFTTVGALVPSGLTGEIVVGSVFDAKFLRLSIDVTNGMFSRNESYGSGSQEEFFRAGFRDIAVGLDMRAAQVSDAPYDSSLTGANVGVFKQTGFTEGSIVAVAMPQVEFKVPDTDDPDGPVNWPFKGMALESADGENDELFLALA